MSDILLQELLSISATARPEHAALRYQGQSRSYAEVAAEAAVVRAGLIRLGIAVQDRVAIFLDKQFETVSAIFGIASAGAVFVPINPALKAPQIVYILKDCNVRVLITTASRFAGLESVLPDCRDLFHVVIVDESCPATSVSCTTWSAFTKDAAGDIRPTVSGTDIAAILYTSGSTGSPKGVVVTHRNLVAGAHSVAQYLGYEPADRILNLPPYSFDFGLNQLFSAFQAGVTAVLHNYIAPHDTMQTLIREGVTGVSGVPTVMIQLAAQDWPTEATRNVRYFSTTGGRMPESAVRMLQEKLPRSKIFLMYGLTESFRSTFLPPDEINRRPNSIGKAIPNAEVLVVRPDGTPCAPHEPGELVHKGVLVSLGYWNDPVRTAERFRPAPGEPSDEPHPEIAVWSGDTVTRDEDGFIYFVGRRDEMIKSSGYRISPTEVEETVFSSGLVSLAAAVGVEDAQLGQAIVLFVVPKNGKSVDDDAILRHCHTQMPAYMVPKHVVVRESLPVNANGKVDRKALAAQSMAEQPSSDATAAVPNRTFPNVLRAFFHRWIQELLGLLQMRKRKFANAHEVFAWAFAGRKIRPQDTFVSLEGDSLSYVSVSAGLEEMLGTLPANWENTAVTEFDRVRRGAFDGRSVRSDIFLRALTIMIIVLNHAHYLALEGGSAVLLMLSGFSFARFNWNGNGRQFFRSVKQLMIRIAIPVWVMLGLVSLHRGEVVWSVVFFFDNWITPYERYWWPPAWFLEVLFQIFLIMLVLGLSGKVRSFGHNHKYAFGFVLLAASFAILCAMAVWHVRLIWSLALTPYLLWIFAAGWLVAASRTRRQKTTTSLVLVAAVGAMIAISAVFTPAIRHVWMCNCGFLVVGFALVLWVDRVTLPRHVTFAMTQLARSTLFVYVFHWPIAIVAESILHNRGIAFLLSLPASILIWLVWESTVRTKNRLARRDGEELAMA
ncbi:MAG TPA: acyl-CoA ligase (AMP-forming), exosortase A system-associated [Rhizomicrobium sp.]|jgi:acyl-CoA ligase (AMP-forming) (exosortase A-associated)